MSIWGKLTGAAAGFLLGGGPIGALAGAFAGHILFDREGQMALANPEEPGVAFTIAIIALGAKLAMADGVVTRDEEEAFTRTFRVPPSEAANVRRVFVDGTTGAFWTGSNHGASIVKLEPLD